MKIYNSYKDFTFDIDLIGQALHHVDFLREIDTAGTLYSPTILPRALYRYEKYWLPLAGDYSDECLSAPIDIEWVWHCHMLRPKKYIEDCETIVGHVVNHTMKSRKDYTSSLKRSKELWEKKYKDVPFHLDMDVVRDDGDMDGFESRLTYDVIAAAGRQKEFFYNVSLPHYKDTKFLQRGLERYQKMLFMKQQYPKQYLIPCYDNDLIWHTHQLNPCVYQTDTMTFYGEIFDHDDSTNDRSAGSKLTNCYAETIELWRNTFNEHLQQPGAMYRTKPPGGVLYKMSEHDVFTLTSKKLSISLDLKVRLADPNSGKIFIQTMGYCEDTEKSRKICKSEEIVCSPFNTFKTQRFDVDTKLTSNVEFEVMHKNGSADCLASPDFDLLDCIRDESGHINNESGSFQRVVPINTDNKFEVYHGSYYVSRTDNVVLSIDKGDYKEETIPDNIREEWGPMNIDKIGPGVDRTCRIATHGLKPPGCKEPLLTVRVIHCPSLRQSYVQVLWQNKIAAVSHFIYPENLPAQSMVNKPTTTLDPMDGERAMLIKNHAGDWAIVAGKFIKSNKPTATKAPAGTLQVRIVKLPEVKIYKCKVGYTNKTFNFHVDHLKADFTEEVIEIKQGNTEIAENVALAISLAILRDQCVPSVK